MSALTDTAAYRALTEGCGLVDRSERGKFALTGAGAKSLLQGLVTNDIEGLAPGEGHYAAVLTNKGKMLGDMRVLDTERELWIDTERVALQGVFNVLYRGRIGFDVAFHKRTLERALLSLVGPRARELTGDPGAAEHASAWVEIAGEEALIVSTDLGVDVIVESERAEAVRATLLAAGAEAVGEDDAEVVRVESGRPRYGVDLDDGVIPQEAGLNERAVAFTKGCYVGQETVARLFYRGKPNRHLRGLRLSVPAALGDPVLLGEREVGRVGSAVVSPRLGPLALAIVRREAEPGATLAVGSAGAPAELVALPFA